jgi:hypothetical protein
MKPQYIENGYKKQERNIQIATSVKIAGRLSQST